MPSTFQIVVVINKREFVATLDDSPTTWKLREMMPLQLTMLDLDNIAKYAFLEDKLPTNAVNVPQIMPGDLLLSDDNCLALFYAPARSPYRYTVLGRLDDPTPLAATLSGRSNVGVELRRG